MSLNISIAMTAWRRPGYLEGSLRSWSLVRGIEDIPMTVYLEPSEVSEKMVSTALASGPPGLRVHENISRLGVLVNPHHALRSEFSVEERDFVILAEEDIEVATDLLEYMSWAAETYKDDPSVIAVHAHGLGGLGMNPELAGQVMRSERFNPLVWGTWRDRWTEIISPTWDFDYTSDPIGFEAGWDWNLTKRVMPAHQMVTIHPRYSRSQHIGFANGVHTTPETFKESWVEHWQQEIEPTTYWEAPE